MEKGESKQELPNQSSSVSGSQDASVSAAPSISLPKGGGAIRGIGEKFAANPVTGTGSMAVPIATSPGRSGFGPQLSLSYDSGSGNGPFGIGWNLSLPSIMRKTDKGLPKDQDVDESDEFILSGAEDLVPILVEDAQGDWVRENILPRKIDEQIYTIQRYRPRIEGLFARIECWINQVDDTDVFWRSISKDNITTWYGKTPNSRISDPNDSTRTFSWLICESHDNKGNAIVYEYTEEDSHDIDSSCAHEINRSIESRSVNRYLKRIKYGNRVPFYPILEENKPVTPLPTEWLFTVVFDYGETHYETLALDPSIPEDAQHQRARVSANSPTTADSKIISTWSIRPDPFSTYRAGFEVRTYRRCERVLMFHQFDELGEEPYLVGSTEFEYRDFDYQDDVTLADELAHKGSTRFLSQIQAVIQSGYVRDDSKPIEERDRIKYITYIKKPLPPVEFEYSKATIQEKLETIEEESLQNLPQGLDGGQYQWADLDGEGAGGILTEQSGTWFYKRNLSPLPFEDDDGQWQVKARFGASESVVQLPSNANLSTGKQQILDLASDGQVDVVTFEGPNSGFFERTTEGDWRPHRPFSSMPNIAFDDPNLKFVDLTGDGHADIFVTEDNAFTWYLSLAEAGFGPAKKARKVLDEDKGPRLVFADGTQSIYLSDMSGDGLSDLVRIRNGEVCYWPNLGYCRFDAKVTMDNAPRFDKPKQFDQRRIRLADIDGTGVTDILYLSDEGVYVYFNQSGNRWSGKHVLKHFPATDNTTNVMAVDLLGNGTACLVWSSPSIANKRIPMRYIDLMGGQKPHLLTKVVNNLGAETNILYAPSTKFYLKDKQAGKQWITRLHFPVHVVEKVETYDVISRNRFVTRYAYHHGYFDGHEREFRGFAMVEQWDTEQFAVLSQSGDLPIGDNINAVSHMPPVHTKTWFHTGVYLKHQHVSSYFAGLLDKHDVGEYFREPGLNDDQARGLLLDDTVLPDNLTSEEEREACRALKGQMLRQEVYALDGTDKEPYPYTVTEQNFTIKQLQPKLENPHAVFFTHPQQVLNYHYERNPTDPRTSHALTLEVDPYGNVLKSVAVGYGRRSGNSTLHGDDKIRQEQTLITYTENAVTNAIDDPLNDPNNYRTPLPCETRSYELTGYNIGASGRYQFDDFVKKSGDHLQHIYDEEINYEDNATAHRQRRLIEHVKTLYRRNELTGPLGWCELESQAIPFESYKLAYTPGLIDKVYQRNAQSLFTNPEDVLAGTAGDQGGYVDLNGDDHWWIPSGHSYFSEAADIINPASTAIDELEEASQHFYLPRKYTSPFLHSNRVRYDTYDLLMQETVDALENTTTVGERHQDGTLAVQGNNYRTLQAEIVMGTNRNVTRVAFDALGLVVGTAIMGKPEDHPAQGDLLEAAFASDLTRQQIVEFFTDPRGHPATDHLGNATSRIIYDIDRFYLSSKAFPNDKSMWLPGFAATIARETHVSDLQAGETSKLQVSFSYSDGLGREIQKKIQAEAGQLDESGPIVDPRWVGSGWTIFNNKGKPVRQFEPFFCESHDFEFGKEQGVSPILFYDPVGRVVATIHPNHSYEKVLFDHWHQISWDVNDTLLLQPNTDDDIKGYLIDNEGKELIPKDLYEPSWYAQRINGDKGPHEQKAAQRTEPHAATPTTARFDSMGRPFLSVANNGKDSGGNDILYETRTILDIEGNQREVIDAKGRVVMRYDYTMVGPEKTEDGSTPNRIHQASMEAGERWILNDIAGNPIRSWDSRGHTFRTVYDVLRRPEEQYVTGEDTLLPDQRLRNKTVLIEKIEYGESLPIDEAIALNLRTRIYKQYDGAGVVTNSGRNPVTDKDEAYDFKGNLLRASRQLCTSYDEIPDWPQNPELDQEVFTSSSRHDALNRPIQQIAPHDSTAVDVKRDITQVTYNDANLLEAIHVWLVKDSEPQSLLDPTSADHAVVKNINYNAKGQRLFIQYGNDTETRYDYDDDTFRLMKLYTRRGESYDQDCGIEPGRFLPPEVPPPDMPCGIQNLRYVYDPAGNITHIHDLAQPRVYFDNGCIDANNDYIYDPIYRLTDASGREHKGDTQPPGPDNRSREFHNPYPASCNDMQHYVERYRYDEVGNIMEMVHHEGGTIESPGPVQWRRRYQYSTVNNQLRSTSRTGEDSKPDYSDNPAEYYQNVYTHDEHGNIICMPHLSGMTWDYKDQLLNTTRQVVNDNPPPNAKVPEKTHYAYDSGRQRVRKVTIRQSGHKKDERIYLGSFEIYRKYNGDGQHITLLRESLHIMDDKQRVALIETKTLDETSGDERNNDEVGQAVIRYQINNHLGSACTELDEQASVISYEEYHPYGTTAYHAKNKNIKAAAKRYRYSGKERDEENGLYYYGARYYSAWLGRWISSDLIGIADGLNMYWYVRNSPTHFVDIYGASSMEPSEEHKAQATLDLLRLHSEGAIRSPLELELAKKSLNITWDIPALDHERINQGSSEPTLESMTREESLNATRQKSIPWKSEETLKWEARMQGRRAAEDFLKGYPILGIGISYGHYMSGQITGEQFAMEAILNIATSAISFRLSTGPLSSQGQLRAEYALLNSERLAFAGEIRGFTYSSIHTPIPLSHSVMQGQNLSRMNASSVMGMSATEVTGIPGSQWLHFRGRQFLGTESRLNLQAGTFEANYQMGRIESLAARAERVFGKRIEYSGQLRGNDLRLQLSIDQTEVLDLHQSVLTVDRVPRGANNILNATSRLGR